MEPPAFELFEVKDDGRIECTFSSGKGVFQQYNDTAPKTFSFSVYKNAATRCLLIVIRSPELRQMLALTDEALLQFGDIALRYDSLSSELSTLEDPMSANFSPDMCAEPRLLMNSFLLDRHMLSGMDVRKMYIHGVISQKHWQVIRLHTSTPFRVRSLDNDLNLFEPIARLLREFEHFDESYTSTQSIPKEGKPLTSKDCFPPQYASVEAFRLECDRLSCWTGRWEQPMNLENCLRLYPAEVKNADSGEQEFLNHALTKCVHSVPIKDLIRRLAPIYDPQIKELSIDLVCSATVPISPAFNSISRLSKVQKMDIITKRLHEVFKSENRWFRGSLIRLSNEQQTVGLGSPHLFKNRWPHKAWSRGTATIRRFLQGKRPDTMEKICRLLQAAYALGSQDPTHTDFRATFVADLDRWRTIVPLRDLQGFDAIVGAVWNKTFHHIDPNEEVEYGSDETLLQLQELLSGLMSNCSLVDIPEWEKEEQDESVSEDNTNFECAIDITYAAVQRALGEMDDPRAYADTRKLPIGGQVVDPIVILMMVGGIFGLIFAFFLIIQSFGIPTLAATLAEGRNRHFANFEERNLYTLSLYMGLPPPTFGQDKEHQSTPVTVLSTTPLPSQVESAAVTPELTPSPVAEDRPKVMVRQLKCSRCGKGFSNRGNLNRHMRHDCDRKAKFPCRNSGCSKGFSRKAYQDKHEVSKCPWRSAGGQTALF